MNTFDRAVTFVMSAEGGYYKDETDRSCWTSGRVGEGLLIGRKWGIRAKDWGKDDLENISEEQAKEFFDFTWRRIKGDQLHPSVAIVVFDSIVMHGYDETMEFIRRNIECRFYGLEYLAHRTAVNLECAQPRNMFKFITKIQRCRIDAVNGGKLVDYSRLGVDPIERILRTQMQAGFILHEDVMEYEAKQKRKRKGKVPE